MKKRLFVFLLVSTIGMLFSISISAQTKLDSILPVRGFCIDAPRPAGLDSFLHFIDAELAPRKVNTLIVQMEYHYQFKSHPELTDSFALSKVDVKKIVAVCKKNNIRVIPQINLLGHQSWANRTGKLLRVYPQFDETPDIKMPEKYVWPNPDNLYCRSYCPLHPDLHPILFAVIDELCDVFESDAFHAGMDEVFYIGDAKCPRCGGRDKAELFEGEVWTIHDHLVQKGREMWIWGDRLLDGKTTGLGEWEASMNNTYRAIDLIPKDVVICDWHYDRADKTAIYFAMKGFRVVTCPWRQPSTALVQINDMLSFRQESTPEMNARFLGIMETTWMRTSYYLNSYYLNQTTITPNENTPWNCFRVMYDAIDKLQ
jgi:Glycosyl hydrolase family 20, catalytic domain